MPKKIKSTSDVGPVVRLGPRCELTFRRVCVGLRRGKMRVTLPQICIVAQFAFSLSKKLWVFT